MKPSPELADQYYTVLTQEIGSPNIEHLRWAFVYAVTKVGFTRYWIDSRLGPGAKFFLHTDGPPTVVCLASELNPLRARLVRRANLRLASVYERRETIISQESITDAVMRSFESLVDA